VAPCYREHQKRHAFARIAEQMSSCGRTTMSDKEVSTAPLVVAAEKRNG
jgi:hypothetical protein